MNLYTYDMDTFEYTGVVTAQKRPNGDYITEMLGATTVHPPEIADGYAAVWSGGAWSLLEDHRQKYDATGVITGGTAYWLDGDTYETAARYMTELGPLPDGALLVQPEEPEPTLDEAKATKITDLDAEATTRITSGFWYEDAEVFEGSLHFSFDLTDQSNFSATMNGANLLMIGQVANLETGMPESITWNGYSDEAHANLVEITFNATQFITFWGYAETSHKNSILETVRGLKLSVGEATTLDEVYAVTWPEVERDV